MSERRVQFVFEQTLLSLVTPDIGHATDKAAGTINRPLDIELATANALLNKLATRFNVITH